MGRLAGRPQAGDGQKGRGALRRDSFCRPCASSLQLPGALCHEPVVRQEREAAKKESPTDQDADDSEGPGCKQYTTAAVKQQLRGRPSCDVSLWRQTRMLFHVG